MICVTQPRPDVADRRSVEAGFTLIELMIAMTISLLILAALVGIFVNLSRSNAEMAKTNSLIENGRLTMQLVESDLIHAGYWGGYVPQFDDLTSSTIPGDVPDAIPDACAAYAAWDSTYRTNLLGVPVQSLDTLPAGGGCLAPLVKRAGTDVLIVRHLDTCIPGDINCEANVAGKLYMQSSLCAAEKNAGTVQSAASDSITLSGNASSANNIYAGLMLRTVAGVGAGQYRTIAAYNGSTRIATVSTPWVTIPNATTSYSFEYVLGTNAYPLYKRDCDGVGSPATLPITSGTAADRRKFISNIYYISDIVHPERAGEVIPTLVRAQFDLDAGTLAHQRPVELIGGVEAFRVELGIDNISKSGAAVNYTEAIIWTDPTTKKTATNRGDGTPDTFVRCTTAAPCTVAQLTNVVAVKIYVLARSRDTTPGYTDTKTYCLGEPNADGTCPLASQVTPAANDHYKRHVFTTSVRLTNISGRRETPL